MTYRVTFAGAGALQFHQMPATAQDALIARAAKLADEPWDAQIDLPDVDPEFRIAEFGEAGLVEFYVRESDHTIHLYNFLWAGQRSPARRHELPKYGRLST